MRPHRRSGFTLLELSVVVMVFGVVAAGVFVAQSLIRSSHLNRILNDYDSYIKAFSEFHEKFLAYPGDMNNAESMWGTDPGGCPNTPTSTTAKTETCNGNGDGKIGDSTTGGVLSSSREWFRAWQHLGNSGFIPEHFSGTIGPGGVTEATPGVNVPRTSQGGVGWTIYYLQLTANGILWADQYGHMMDVGRAVAGNKTTGAFLTPDEALAVDTKVDDGRPGRGMIRAWRTGVLSGCTTNDVSQNAQTYATTTNAQLCSLVFVTGY